MIIEAKADFTHEKNGIEERYTARVCFNTKKVVSLWSDPDPDKCIVDFNGAEALTLYVPFNQMKRDIFGE